MVKDNIDKIGKYGVMSLGQVRIRVKILDMKHAWGQVRYQVTPAEGSGVMWVEKLISIETHEKAN